MSFRLVPNSVTLDDLERRSSPNCRNFAEFGSFQSGLRKVFEETPILFATEM